MTSKKILLVAPHNINLGIDTPIAILDCAPYLRQQGFEVNICKFPKVPVNKKYDVIGLSCIGNCAGTIFDQLGVIKHIYPKTPVIVGGKWTHTMTEEEKSRLLELEVVVEKGPAELFFTGDDEIHFSKYPAWDNKDFDLLWEGGEALMSSRGCPYNCNFCNNTEKKISYFPALRTVKNIELVLSKAGTVFFVDDVFVANFEHAKEIYEISKKRKIEIEGRSRFFVHVNFINEKTIELINLFKPFHVAIGLESGSQLILDKMNKKVKLSRMQEIVPTLAQHTAIHALWLIGYPFETPETLEETYLLMKKFKPYIKSNWVSCYAPVPNTVGYAMARKTGGTFLPLFNNTRPSFVPQGLSEEILITYRDKMMQLNDIK